MKFIKERYEEKMQAALDNTDPESGHAACDKVLCELLTKLGFEKVVQLYELQIKWCG